MGNNKSEEYSCKINTQKEPGNGADLKEVIN